MIFWIKVVLFRRRRLVRVHLAENLPSIEGVLVGIEAGHYRLAKARHIVDEATEHPLVGEAWVPRERVVYVQVIG